MIDPSGLIASDWFEDIKAKAAEVKAKAAEVADATIESVKKPLVNTFNDAKENVTNSYAELLGQRPENAPSGYGDLTIEEVGAIQSEVDMAHRPLDVVGSAAHGERISVGTDLPIGKGMGYRSDIDYTTGRASLPYFEGAKLPGLDKHGVLSGAPVSGTRSIRFEPFRKPRIIKKNP